jgi:redox-sensitive bicupin YhaK (pirin superfamily)
MEGAGAPCHYCRHCSAWAYPVEGEVQDNNDAAHHHGLAAAVVDYSRELELSAQQQSHLIMLWLTLTSIITHIYMHPQLEFPCDIYHYICHIFLFFATTRLLLVNNRG